MTHRASLPPPSNAAASVLLPAPLLPLLAPRGRHYGLGLHTASEAANTHGGSVSLANSPSGGAVATIAVPCEGLTTQALTGACLAIKRFPDNNARCRDRPG